MFMCVVIVQCMFCCIHSYFGGGHHHFGEHNKKQIELISIPFFVNFFFFNVRNKINYNLKFKHITKTITADADLNVLKIFLEK